MLLGTSNGYAKLLAHVTNCKPPFSKKQIGTNARRAAKKSAF